MEFREQCRQLDGEERLSKGKDAKAGIEKDARLLSQVRGILLTCLLPYQVAKVASAALPSPGWFRCFS